MIEDYKGEFLTEESYLSSDWSEYWVFRVEGGYRVWTFQPSKCLVEGLEEV